MPKPKHDPLAEALTGLRGALTATAVFSLVINLLALTVPMHMMHVYDNVLTSRSGSTLFFLGVLALGLLAALGLLEWLRARILARIGAHLDETLGDRLFAASIAERLAGRPENPGQPLRDLDALRGFAGGGGLQVLFDAPWVPIFVALTFLLNPWLGLIALGGAVVLFVIAIANERATRRMAQTAAAETIAAQGFADSALRNAEAIGALGMGEAIVRRWRSRHGKAVAYQGRIADRAGGFTAATKFWRPFLQIAMLSAGAWLAIESVITPGVMIAASIVMARALAPVEAAIGSWRGFVAARSARTRLRELLARRPPPPQRLKLPVPRGELRVSSLYVSPPGLLKPTLRGVSLALAPGESLGVIGPSGSGKSTLARALIGVWPQVAGEVRLDGAALADFDNTSLGRSIGYLPQDIELFDGTVADNIARFREPDPDGVIAAARLTRVHEMVLRLPQAYDTPIGPGGEALSGGQRQRIALARALYGRPALAVLDEPNAHLDGEGEDALRQALAALKAQGTTVVLIAHRPQLIAAVDRILVLNDGAAEMLGPRAEVLAKVTRRAATPLVAAAGGA